MTMAPNHHAGQGHFSGLGGLLAGLSMTVGRRTSSRLAARLSDAGPGDHVVDVGCGPGSAARAAARLGARVTGVDPAPVMLRLARRLTRANDRITYVEGAAEALPLADGAASVLWSIASVHHWADLARGLREADRVLAPGGRFVAIEKEARPGATGHASHGWTDERAAAFADACRAEGFADVRIERGERRGRGLVAVVAATPARPV